MKRIAIQNNLQEVRLQLEGRGYQVVDFNSRGNVDAIVYIDDYTGIQNMNNEGDKSSLGAVLVNARNKNIDQIVYIIENRRYEGLFT